MKSDVGEKVAKGENLNGWMLNWKLEEDFTEDFLQV